MDDYQDQSTNGQVIAGAGAAAAVLAAVALLLSRKKAKPKSQAEEIRQAVDEALSQARSSGWRLLAQAPAKSEDLERAATEGRRFFERRHKAEQRRADAAAEQVKRWGRAVEQERDHAPTSAQQIAALAAAAAVERVERALGVGAQLAETAREQAPQMAHRLGEDVVPSLRDIAAQAAEAALERWNELREHAPDLRAPDLRHLEDNALHLATTGGDLARDTGAAVAGRAAELSRRAAEATEQTVGRARDASKKGAVVAGHAKDASVRTAEATVETGKDTGAILFWLGAAAGLIFYVLLNEERRQQITDAVQAVIKDIQGYDDEF
jgi:hypothetical protein